MAESINQSFPIQTSLRLNAAQNDWLKETAARRGVTVRTVVRSLIDNQLNADRVIYACTPEMVRDLQFVADKLGIPPQELAARYIAAGIATTCARKGIDPTTEN